MGKLIYSAIMSLDGYVADERGNFDWARPDEAVHRFVNELERPVGTFLYGRRMYETMVHWETAQNVPDQPQFALDFADLWQATDKIVFSRTLDAVSSSRTTIRREFDAASIRALKAAAAKDVTVGGPELAGHALRAGLVDELQLFLVPVLVGGGNQALPDGVFNRLALAEERRFANGTVYLRYELDR
ncbi:MAG TPA: dihydrofolate reductase family protein [Candidatus Dormibacteraeota bacterium]